ncbi:MAG: hypothetical protein WDW36_006873 [Sanguina aurantia]
MCTASGDDALTFSKLAAPPTVSACHITNYAKNTDGWVWNLGRVQQHFGEAVWGEIWARMLRSAGLTVAAARQSLQEATEWLQPSIQHYGFQLLGFDYLVDSSRQPWLLEVNSAPSITVHHANPETCRLIHAAKYAMLQDMLQLVQHRLYSDTTGPKTGRRRPTRPLKRAQQGTAAESGVWGGSVSGGGGRAGHISTSLDLFNEMPTGDRGVVATRTIAKGEQLMLLPLQRVLHLPSLDDFIKNPALYEATATKFLLEFTPTLSAFTATVMLLLSEFARGKESPFREYLASLPQEVDCLLSWSKEDKDELKGTAIDDEGREQTQAFFAREALPVISARPDLWPAPWNSVSRFGQVAGVAQSRAFHMEESNWVTGSAKESSNLYLLPAVDMINHASDPSRRNAILSKLNQPMSKVVGGAEQAVEWAFCVTAECDIPAGQEVLHSYGDLGDAALLQTYGFVDAAIGTEDEPFVNPCNHVLIPFQSIQRVCRQMNKDQGDDDSGFSKAKKASAAATHKQLEDRKVAMLVSCKLLQAAAPANTEFVLTLGNPLPDTLLTVIQVLLMLEGEFAMLLANNGPKDGEAYSLGTDLLEEDAEFGEMVAFALVQVLDIASHRYPTTAAQDVTMLANAEGFRSLRHFYAVSVRLGEKQILAEASKAVVQMIVDARSGDPPGGASDDVASDDDEGDEESEGEASDESEGEASEGHTQPAVAPARHTPDTVWPPGAGHPVLARAGLAPSRKRRKGLGAEALVDQAGSDDEGEADDGEDDDAPDSDDSDKVGYGAGFDDNDGPGEAHDRAHAGNGKAKK